ncbi:MAG TPA: methyltransferase domain-containing protein [Puia sp.]|jgi:SAM-dependent methyltransferase|nr:methyltransferase domain-containing protein [Puia sp.]
MKKGQLPYEFDPPITSPAYLTRNRLLKGIARHTTAMTGRLLDFGCGSKPYRSLFRVDEYIGLDFENPGHPHVNEQIDVFYDGKRVPFEDFSFDCIFSSEVFEHVFNLPEVLEELNRVLKPGGLILVTCPFAICEHEVPNDFARYSSYGLRYLMNEHGFEMVMQEKTGNSVETVIQLWIMYIHQHISPVFRRIPGVRSAFRFLTYTSLNLWALLLSKILPDSRDLYLNNIIVCKKRGPVS